MFRLMVFLALIALLLVLESVQVVQAGAPAPAPTVCRPNYTKKRNVCEKLITNCAAIYLPMKWVGKGCRQLPGHKPLGDGGCQCKGYCGYSCKTPCVKDKECYWNAAAKSCYVKATNEKGVPIDPCPNSTDTKSPTSKAPSTSPSLNPISSQPSVVPSTSPTTARPSSAPSGAPQKIPA